MTLEEKQKENAQWRERFLCALLCLSDRPVEIVTAEHTHLRASYHTSDSNFQRIAVSDLETPMGVVPHALLRSMDLISMTFNAPTFEKHGSTS
ncbi:unnamed protein product [Soboliphyme baturini]|uniref:PH domain-containing protein n=1 Tax=Soboliphyme baturini TaxID=241478 RepID=A0A183IBA7_9BILA|nr:unnamed protein product [Soboliphyme baturini]